MKRLIKAIIIGTGLLLCLATAASAEEARPYFTLIGGVALMNDVDLSDNTGDYAFKMETGYFLGGVIGYDLGNKYPQLGEGRVEIELGYRFNDLDKTKFASGTLGADGDITSFSLMLNAIADYPNFSPNYIPYFGLGLGAANISVNDSEVEGSPMIDDDDTRFAYQFLAGLTFEITERIDIDCGYRYFATLDPEFKDTQGRKVDAEYGNHSFEIGLRYMF